MTVKIHALIFELESESSKSLIVWPDENGNGQFTHHAHPEKTMLDLEAGHTVVNSGNAHVVRSVKPWRTSLCKDESSYPTIRCGRDWLENPTVVE